MENTILQQLSFDFGGETVTTLPSIPEREQEIAPVLKGLGISPRLLGLFDYMPVAGEVIEACYSIYPEKAQVVDSVMSLACPGEIMRPWGMDAYRRHVRELIDRSTRGADTRLPTNAEKVCAVAGVTLLTAVKREVGMLYWKLFKEVFPEHIPKLHHDMRMFEIKEWDHGQVESHEAFLDHQLTNTDREFTLKRPSVELKLFWTANMPYAPEGFEPLTHGNHLA